MAKQHATHEHALNAESRFIRRKNGDGRIARTREVCARTVSRGSWRGICPASGGAHPKRMFSVETFIMLPRLTPGRLQSPECPSLAWVASYAIVGPYDYLDVFRAPNVELAIKASSTSGA